MKRTFRHISAFVLSVLIFTGLCSAQSGSAVSLDQTANLPTITRVTAPTNLKASLSSNMGVTLNWTDNATNESGFVLQRRMIASPSPAGDFIDLATLSANVTTYKDTISAGLLVAGYNQAEYRIKATGSLLIPDSSYTDSVVIAIKAPEKPQVSVDFTVNGSVVVMWYGCTQSLVDHYEILRKAPGDSGFSLFATTQPDVLYCNDETQKQAGEYQYKVYAIGFIDDYQGLPVSITIPGTPPAAPSNLVFPQVLSDNTLSFTFTDNSNNEAGFWAEYSIDGVVKEPIKFPANQAHFSIRNNPVGTISVSVKAVNAAGSSGISNTVTFSMPMTAPAAPSNLAAVALAGSTVSLTWSDNSNNEAGFVIERKTGSGGFAQISETPFNVTSYTDSGLIPGTVYTYRVYGKNGTGVSAYSGTANATTPASTSSVDYSTADAWAVPEIEAAINYHLVTDRLLGNFQQDITREEFCEIAVKLYEALSGSLALPVAPNPFMDTTNPEILKAFNLGITKGTASDKFSPNNHITRQEISVMIVRALGAAVPGINTAVTNHAVYADESLIASWASPSVHYADDKDIMNGIGNNMFDPLNDVTREQGIAIIKRAYESIV